MGLPVAVSSGLAVAYVRVSTQDQAESGLWVEAQQLSIQTAAARLGLTVTETFNDAGVGGRLPLEQRGALLALRTTRSLQHDLMVRMAVFRPAS